VVFHVFSFLSMWVERGIISLSRAGRFVRLCKHGIPSGAMLLVVDDLSELLGLEKGQETSFQPQAAELAFPQDVRVKLGDGCGDA
jgi:hypothetical protein